MIFKTSIVGIQTKTEMPYSDLSNDNSSGGSEEDSLVFYRVNVTFSSEERVQIFLRNVDDPSDWNERRTDGIINVWCIMEVSTMHLFRLWVRDCATCLGFSIDYTTTKR